MKARGHDVCLRLFQNGGEQKEFNEVVSFDVDFGLATETADYVGAANAQVFGVNNPATIRLTLEPGSRAFGALVAAQLEANRPNAIRQGVDIDFTASLDFGDGGRERWAFSGCVLGAPNVSSSSRTARVQGSFELMCPTPERI